MKVVGRGGRKEQKKCEGKKIRSICSLSFKKIDEESD
jgi:hypothetical protein